MNAIAFDLLQASPFAPSLVVRWLGLQPYEKVWHSMQQFTRERNKSIADEIWLLEHPPVFTQGQNGKPEHVLNPGNIPIIRTDRGGQVTYHGPGQLMIYVLVDLRRKQLYLRPFVSLLECALVDLLKEYQIAAFTRPDAPGVYVKNVKHPQKIASIGLRISKGCSYHGIALNVDLDLNPFRRINPCGFQNLEMTTFFAEGGLKSTRETGRKLIPHLLKNLRYTTAHCAFANLE